MTSQTENLENKTTNGLYWENEKPVLNLKKQAFAYNIIAIPLAVAGVLHPVVAEIAMALSSITVVTNANLLRRKRI